MSARNILIVDDDHAFRGRVREALGGIYRITEVADEAGFRREYRPYTYNLVIMDMRLKEEREGLDLLREIRAYDELQPVIMVSSYGDTDATLDAIESGALMFLHKQEFSPELLARLVEALLQQGRLQRRIAALEERLQQDEPTDFIGTSPAMRQASQLVRRATDEPESWIVAAGESGSGRTQTARVVHDFNRRRVGGPLVTASLAGLSDSEAITALFGANRVSGGRPRRKGLLEQANGGVLYLGGLDMISEKVCKKLSDSLRQRFLVQGADAMRIPLDIQIIAGVGPEGLERLEWLRSVSPGGRLVEIFLPPLRERKEDVPLLVTFFLQGMRQGGQTTARTVSKSALTLLEAQSWQGNVLELRNAVEFAAIRAAVNHDEELKPEHLPANLLRASTSSSQVSESWDYREHLARTELWLANRAIEELNLENKTALGEALGYNDRFAFMRRLSKCLEEFPAMGSEFPLVAELFVKDGRSKGARRSAA